MDPLSELDHATERMRNAMARQDRAFRNLVIAIWCLVVVVLLNLAVVIWRLMIE